MGDMANSEHVAKLQEGVEAWNAWRVQDLVIFPDLSRANLRGMDHSRVNLSGADFSKADLSAANLEEADLDRADLIRADLGGANLNGADLSWTNLDEADLDLGFRRVGTRLGAMRLQTGAPRISGNWACAYALTGCLECTVMARTRLGSGIARDLKSCRTGCEGSFIRKKLCDCCGMRCRLAGKRKLSSWM